MKTIRIVFLVSLILPKLVLAESLSERLIDILGTKAVWDEYVTLITLSNTLPASQHSDLDILSIEHAERMNNIQEELLNWEDIKVVLITSYEQTYTSQELEELVRFLESPLGQKWLMAESQNNEVFKQTMATKVGEYTAAVTEELNRYKEALATSSAEYENQ